ncbi:protein trichome birefringence-like 19 [Phalaenopsis equestris]|uniref:protein trichome birefringence-like 19 n=1 Tax=Phalaenopsis equestris TaxID=78828 RepID=UPI0009E3C172|nr:protein trichome birefringence-like 19 [Phalaenopsis equestris]
MKPRPIELPIGRLPFLNFFSVLKVFFLTALLVLFLNVTFTLYTNVSTRYYTYPHPPFLRITSSSTFSFSSSSTFFSTSSSHHDPCSNSPPSPSNPSSLIQSSPPSSDSLPSSSSFSSSNPKPTSIDKPSSSYLNSSLPSSSSSSPPNLRGKRKVLVKGCDLSKGEWIRDPKAPYYTNSTCWTIQEHQNCMKYGRPNLDFLKWRWKPDGCELPLLEPAEFLEFMRGKNLAFIGDSLARNQMQSLMCLLSRVEYPQEIWPPAENVTQMIYKNYNFTIWAFWSPFLIRAEETTTTNKYDMWNLYLDEPDQLWQRQMAKFDHIVLNTGNWYSRPAQFYAKQKLIGCHYCLFKRTPFMSLYKAHRQAFRTAMDAIVDNKQGFKGLTIVRTVSPSHFEGGEWNKGGDCRRTAPFRRGGAKLVGMDLGLYKDQLKEFWKAKWEGNEKGLEFRLLDTTQAMLLRPDGHPSRYGHWPREKRVLYNDCVHWCLPGPVDMWNDLLFLVLSV